MSGPQSSSVQRLYTICKPNLNHNWNCNQNHSYLYIWSIIISGHHQCSLTTVRTRHKLFIHSHPMRWVVFGLSASSFGYQCAVLCDIESTIIAPLLHLAFNFIAKIKRVSESKQLRWFTSQHLVAEILSPTTCFNQHFDFCSWSYGPYFHRVSLTRINISCIEQKCNNTTQKDI